MKVMGFFWVGFPTLSAWTIKMPDEVISTTAGSAVVMYWTSVSILTWWLLSKSLIRQSSFEVSEIVPRTVGSSEQAAKKITAKIHNRMCFIFLIIFIN